MSEKAPTPWQVGQDAAAGKLAALFDEWDTAGSSTLAGLADAILARWRLVPVEPESIAESVEHAGKVAMDAPYKAFRPRTCTCPDGPQPFHSWRAHPEKYGPG